jgi:hypothetical protein
MITETGYSVGLARVKAKTLSGSGRVSWVRSGPGRVTGLRLFSYPGAIGLARLARVRQKLHLGLVLALSLNPGWVSWVNQFRSDRSG